MLSRHLKAAFAPPQPQKSYCIRNAKSGTSEIFCNMAVVRPPILLASQDVQKRLELSFSSRKDAEMPPALLTGKFGRGGITVLTAAKIAVALQCAFVQFVSAIVELFAVVADVGT
jgi:hypothetical protein